MLLTSLRRLRAYVVGHGSDPLANNVNNNRLLTNWLVSTSQQIENYLGRDIEIKQRTEYIDLESGQLSFRVNAYPIINLSIVETDISGLWNGSGESEITDCFKGSDNNTVILSSSQGVDAYKGLRITYTGGLAYHAVNSRFAMKSLASGETWTVGNYVQGGSTYSIGIVSASANSEATLTVENYYGQFEKDEVLTEYEEEACTTASGMYGTIQTINRQSLSECAAPIVMATEAQIRYYYKHVIDFENTGFQRNGTTIRQNALVKKKQPLTKEVIEMLEDYRRVL